MKNIKKKLIIVLTVLCLFSCVGCSKENKQSEVGEKSNTIKESNKE